MLVTGAAGGIGAATVKMLTQQGYDVVAATHRDGDLELDVTDPASVVAAAKAVAARLNGRGLRAVVNNAGIIVQGPQELVPAADLQWQFAVNVLGPAEVTRAFLPLLRAGNGRVINVSAPTARLPIPFAGPIGASKAALESLSDALRLELRPWGIPVVVVVRVRSGPRYSPRPAWRRRRPWPRPGRIGPRCIKSSSKRSEQL